MITGLVLVYLSASASFLLAQEADDDFQKNYVVISSHYIKAVEIAHSNTNYDYFIGTIAYQRMIEKGWGIRLGIQPLIWARSNFEGLDSTAGMGTNIGWVGYFGSQDYPVFYVDFDIGGMLFNEDVPVEGAKKFNWSLGAGGGMEFPVSKNHSMFFGYRYSHISNSNTGTRNPGVNGHSLVFGIRYKL